nr:MAG TPA: Major capsid protein [Microviridae sp.]
MANIFSKKDQYIDRVNRSTFDLSFVNNFTTNFGVITPVCLLPVGFGDSVQINAKFNLQLMPTVFPIQTQMYARLHFVYVRTRTIWEDWQKFFGGDESVVPPWIDFSDHASHSDRMTVDEDLQTSSLADYLGVPTTITGTYGVTVKAIPELSISQQAQVNAVTGTKGWSFPYGSITYDSAQEIYDGKYSTVDFPDLFDELSFSLDGQNVPRCFAYPFYWHDVTSTASPTFYLNLNSMPPLLKDAINDGDVWFMAYSTGDRKASDCKMGQVVLSDFENDVASYSLTFSAASTQFSFILLFNAYKERSKNIFIWASPDPSYPQVNDVVLNDDVVAYFRNLRLEASFTTAEWTKPEASNCPFFTSSPSNLPPIPLSALPFRVYEAYYNAFGRDVRNNPFMIDGKAEYNRYVPSLAGGPDRNKYQLHYANWEPDAYTTALQSPQAGVAPLVGISSLGEAQFRDASGTVYTAQLETADDGDTVTGFSMRSSDAPADVVRNLIGMATSGISISDFRNVNSLQRFLEIRIRQSPRYLNLVKGLFNVNLDYDELMMPEFLGGISDNVPVYKVTQTTPTDGSPLGSFAGQGFIQSGMKHVIRKYCPEEGYILGVLSVVPVANYTQLLMPHWTRMSLLDWHFPQFNNVSFQPMTYKNLCPYQAYAVNPANINNVFGYQRAWWDLISSFDEVHGQFRSSLRNFVINRVFDSAPELSQDFLLVNPDHVNDVFATTAENGDKILGSIAFDITKKTTIPRNSVPHIE